MSERRCAICGGKIPPQLMRVCVCEHCIVKIYAQKKKLKGEVNIIWKHE